MLVIDTEGTGATNSNDTRDTRIFALALLLSSYFIYNSQGSIDEPALANLQVVTEVSRMVRVQAEEVAAVAPWNAPSDESEDGGDQLSDFFPQFMWVVRDFVLEMRAEDGAALQESEYLEEALRCGRGGAAKDEIRQALLQAFPARDCATLVRPCNGRCDVSWVRWNLATPRRRSRTTTASTRSASPIPTRRWQRRRRK